MLMRVIWSLFFGDLNQSEKLSEIKPPLLRSDDMSAGDITIVGIISFMYLYCMFIPLWIHNLSDAILITFDH